MSEKLNLPNLAKASILTVVAYFLSMVGAVQAKELQQVTPPIQTSAETQLPANLGEPLPNLREKVDTQIARIKYAHLKAKIEEDKLILPEELVKEFNDLNLGQTLIFDIRPNTNRFIIANLLDKENPVLIFYAHLIEKIIQNAQENDREFYPKLLDLFPDKNGDIRTNAPNIRFIIDDSKPEFPIENFKVPRVDPITLSEVSEGGRFVPFCSGAIETNLKGEIKIVFQAKHCLEGVVKFLVSEGNGLFGANEIDISKNIILESGDFAIIVEKSLEALEIAEKRVIAMHRAGVYVKSIARFSTLDQKTKPSPGFIGPLSEEESILPIIKKDPGLRADITNLIPVLVSTAFSPVDSHVQNKQLSFFGEVDSFRGKHILNSNGGGITKPELNIISKVGNRDHMSPGVSGALLTTVIKGDDGKYFPAVLGTSIGSPYQSYSYDTKPISNGAQTFSYIDDLDLPNLLRQIQKYKTILKANPHHKIEPLIGKRVYQSNFLIQKIENSVSKLLNSTVSKLLKKPIDDFKALSKAEPKAVKFLIDNIAMIKYQVQYERMVKDLFKKYRVELGELTDEEAVENELLNKFLEGPFYKSKPKKSKPERIKSFLGSGYLEAARQDPKWRAIMRSVAMRLGPDYAKAFDEYMVTK